MTAALRGILWMGGALLSFSAMAVAVRELVDTMGAFQILFLRSLVTLVMVLAALPRYGFGALRTGLLRIHTVRNLLYFCGQWLWVYAIAALPLATVFAIEFTMPVWTALLAMLLLGERLAGSDTPLAVLFYMSVIQMPFGLVPALANWAVPVAADLPWILLVGGAGFSAHYCLTRSFRLADASLVVPIDFLRLPLIAAVGALLYGEPLDWTIMLGAAVMCAGIWYSVRREGRM